LRIDDNESFLRNNDCGIAIDHQRGLSNGSKYMVGHTFELELPRRHGISGKRQASSATEQGSALKE
jgi:hypothetical protein